MNEFVKTPRSITVDEMYSSHRFLFGRKFWKPQEIVSLSPDEVPNPHMMITGTSGSGKTSLLRPYLKYLGRMGKTVHILDLKGDICVGDEENLMTFKARNSNMGISPFEFINDIDSGGPKLQAVELVEMIKRSFLPGMGPSQRGILLEVILDLYKLHGFHDDDPTTWGMDDDRETLSARLPTIEDLRDLVSDVLELTTEGADADFTKHLQKTGAKAVKIKSRINTINRSINEVKHEPDDNVDEKLGKLYKSKKEAEAELALLKEKFLEKADEAFDYYYLSGGNPFATALTEANKEEKYKHLNLKYYSKSSVKQVLESLLTHLNTLVTSGVFGRVPPPVKSGINRYLIKDLSVDVQTFFVDTMLRKIFRAVKNRGDYNRLSEEHKRKRGMRFDTVICIDEAQLIAPLPRSKEAKDPTNGLNRIVTEARGYGLSIVLLSQSPSVFSDFIRTNVANKIILKTEKSDVPVVRKMLDVDAKDLETIRNHFGTGLIVNPNGKMEPVAFPWADL